MLDLALKFLTDELNAFILALTCASFGASVPTRLATDAGKWAIPDDQVGVAVEALGHQRGAGPRLTEDEEHLSRSRGPRGGGSRWPRPGGTGRRRGPRG